MSERDEVWAALHPTGFLHALRDAHTRAVATVLGALSRTAGFKERSFGYTSFDVMESMLDQVFGVFGPGPDAGPTDQPAGVVRDDLNGSPGWRFGGWRVILKRHRLGAVRQIRWAAESVTKQAVAGQSYPDDPQEELDLGIDLRAARRDGAVTLVLAHSASDDPAEVELFLGRPRFNPHGEDPWWWLLPLTAEALGSDPRRVRPAGLQPLWSDGEADPPVRLRDLPLSRPGAASSDGA